MTIAAGKARISPICSPITDPNNATKIPKKAAINRPNTAKIIADFDIDDADLAN